MSRNSRGAPPRRTRLRVQPLYCFSQGSSQPCRRCPLIPAHKLGAGAGARRSPIAKVTDRPALSLWRRLGWACPARTIARAIKRRQRAGRSCITRPPAPILLWANKDSGGPPAEPPPSSLLFNANSPRRRGLHGSITHCYDHLSASTTESFCSLFIWVF
ncbi:hypothetical protein L227DRAFT_9906 [Lentinus tigrinus ALCF2SS1-6]|uniref:Uncharacterized protein n=1 Tax=Lentinus tigrinus ALCF2SS1-6 TaxID=1328759 RepID=A0A5C2T4B3_9APHY|nr:hypothetical protein L227DRAFT_9906 [Lentinus tigrinus ALCF2SS1-6]